jgi:hypothetical protein
MTPARLVELVRLDRAKQLLETTRWPLARVANRSGLGSAATLARTFRRRLASARARGIMLGRQVGQCPSDKKAKKVLALHKEGLSYRRIGRNLSRSRRCCSPGP